MLSEGLGGRTKTVMTHAGVPVDSVQAVVGREQNTDLMLSVLCDEGEVTLFGAPSVVVVNTPLC